MIDNSMYTNKTPPTKQSSKGGYHARNKRFSPPWAEFSVFVHPASAYRHWE
jgi:hypothetical protein